MRMLGHWVSVGVSRWERCNGDFVAVGVGVRPLGMGPIAPCHVGGAVTVPLAKRFLLDFTRRSRRLSVSVVAVRLAL
jgi:hypothetical protein